MVLTLVNLPCQSRNYVHYFLDSLVLSASPEKKASRIEEREEELHMDHQLQIRI